MANKPLSREEWGEYISTVKKQEKLAYIEKKTYVVIFKVLCPTCAHNAEMGKRIIYNCPRCFANKWHNCSISQVRSGKILQAIQVKYPTVEWVKAYDQDRVEQWSWKRHESQYKQDVMGHWIPKND